MSGENLFMTCEQQRRRSACAFGQSDQHLCFHCLDSIISLVSISEFSSLYLVSVAAQASLSLTWSETPNTGFLMTWLFLPVFLFMVVTWFGWVTPKLALASNNCIIKKRWALPEEYHPDELVGWSPRQQQSY